MSIIRSSNPITYTQFCAADAATYRSENEPAAAAVVERDGLVLLQRVSLCVDMLSLVELW